MVIKWLFDKIFGSIILFAALPVMALVAMAIKFDSRGPVAFVQKRYGFNNEPIEVYKFRSMYIDQCDATGSKGGHQERPAGDTRRSHYSPGLASMSCRNYSMSFSKAICRWSDRGHMR